MSEVRRGTQSRGRFAPPPLPGTTGRRGFCNCNITLCLKIYQEGVIVVYFSSGIYRRGSIAPPPRPLLPTNSPLDNRD